MVEQEWTNNPKPAAVGVPTKVPWPIAVDKEGKEVAPPKMRSKPDAKGKVMEYDRPDIVNQNDPTSEASFAEVKAFDRMVRKKVRTDNYLREAALKKHMESFVDPTAKK